MDWFPFDVPAYDADTEHLTTLEHGAYFLLIKRYYQSRRPLPDHDQALANIALLPLPEWQRIATTIRAFFRASRDGKLHLKRADQVLNAQDLRAARLSENAKKAADVRWGNINELDAARMQAACVTYAEPMLRERETKKDITNLVPVESVVATSATAAKPKGKPDDRRTRGSRLAADWQPSAEDQAYADARGFRGGDLGHIAEHFRDYWIALPSPRGLKVDWAATWRTWVRREQQQGHPALALNGAGGPQPRSSGPATGSWAAATRRALAKGGGGGIH